MTTTLVAVYGTLKKGFGNHHLLQTSKFIAAGSISGHRLYQSGIPYVVCDATSPYTVAVEVYEVSPATLERLDSLEGHPDWYRREVTSVQLSSGETVNAAVYKMRNQPYNTVENTSGEY